MRENSVARARVSFQQEYPMRNNHLLTKGLGAKLLAAGAEHKNDPDAMPIVKFVTTNGEFSWLISEMFDGDTLWGLCDLGCGRVEFSHVSLYDLNTLSGQLGLPVERDRHFTPTKTLMEYWEASLKKGLSGDAT
jgi:hypothetical protein